MPSQPWSPTSSTKKACERHQAELKRIGNNPAVDTKRAAGGGAGGFGADVADQVGDLFRFGVALHQRRRAALGEAALDEIVDGGSGGLGAPGQTDRPHRGP